MHDHLSFNVKSNLHPNQHCFVKSNSTVTDLVTYLYYVLRSVCSEGQFVSVYFYLRKAFDKDPHTLLLDKIDNFGLSSFFVQRFKSCLSNRFFFVHTLGKFPSSVSVLLGVPQGSILGPLWFNILITTFMLKLIIPNLSYLLMI
jgi:retron-type reverse transcriptase